MKSISEISSWGGIDADNDRLLMACFQDHEAYNQLINFERYIILGRKGTGKTAIFKKLLTQQDSNTFTYGHTFADYPWHFHDKQIKLGVPEFDKYTHSWKYLILLTISKILLNQDQTTPYDDASFDKLRTIESFILDTYGTRDPDVTQIFTPSRTLKLKPSFQIDLHVLKMGASTQEICMSDLPIIVQDLNANLSDCVINSLNPANKYYILFDQLDLGFDPKDDNYNNRLIGLLLAARDLNNLAKDAGKQLSISTFLRDDIYNKLKFEDKNKLTIACSTFIEWDVRGNYTLKSLMEKRFTELLKSTDHESIKWSDVFDEDSLMTGKQTKYNYMLDRTFLRPRDIIQFCNKALEQHNQYNRDSPKIINKKLMMQKQNIAYIFVMKLMMRYINTFPIMKNL